MGIRPVLLFKTTLWFLTLESFCSGDLGYLDEEEFLFIADRVKDIVRSFRLCSSLISPSSPWTTGQLTKCRAHLQIVRSGENIASVMVEDALSHHTAVREAAVVPVPCEVHGEQVA